MAGSGEWSLRVDGVRRLRRDLRRAGEDLTDLKDAHAEVAEIAARAAEARAPRRTGRLAASVRGNRAASGAAVRAGRARIPYAGPIHWGWPARNIAPQPFAAEAAQQTQHVWLPVYERAVEAARDRVAGNRY